VLGLLGAFVVFGGGFLWRELTARFPMLELAMFRVRRFAVGTAAGLLSYIVLFGVLFATPFYLERVRGWSPAQSGLMLTALPLGIAAIAPAAGRLMDRVGARTPTTAGMALTALGLELLALGRGSAVGLAGGLVLAGAGLGLFTPANNASIMANAPARRSGVASGIVNLSRGLGSALGLALTAMVLDLATGGSRPSSISSAAFRDGLQFLAAVALAAAVLSAFRRPKAPEPVPVS